MKSHSFQEHSFRGRRDIEESLIEMNAEIKDLKSPDHLKEMTGIAFPAIVDLCRRAILPHLKERGIKIVRQGNSLGEIVTDMDIESNRLFLDGDHKINFPGFHTLYPGSFTEEEDSGYRLESDVVYENDPCDGTGDAVKTAGSKNPIWPTNLTTKLVRNSETGLFVPTAGLIYSVVGEYGIVSDGRELFLGVPDEKRRFKKIPTKKIGHIESKKVSVNWRESYPQNNLYSNFYQFMQDEGWEIKKVRCGGAGDQALRLVRGCLEPVNKEWADDFFNLEPIDIIFNAQPDWKTWDTDPTCVIGKALGWPEPTDIYGHNLTANAANQNFKDMHHTTGTVFSSSTELAGQFIELARKFMDKFPNNSLLEKNY